MKREVIKEAETIEEAKAAAAAAMDLPASELQFEILQMPTKKTFGLFGGNPAKVRAFYEVTPARRAADYLREILENMNVPNPDITTKEEESGCTIRLSGDNLGFIIGRRGETLDALQYIVGLVANRVENTYYRVTLDIGNYREKREQSLGGLARKMAGQAARTGRKTALEPMNPYERRIIHSVVHEIDGATSWSVGSEPNRHVVIGPSDNNRSDGRPQKGGRHNRSTQKNERVGGGGREAAADRPQRPERASRAKRSDSGEQAEREFREFIPRSNPLPSVDGATPPSKTLSEKEKSSALYGRIDL
ncbi:MAG: protein jag [Oscillospiraceae bacterium]|nr:protein jag [Oscillospiraceae bacterium]